MSKFEPRAVSDFIVSDPDAALTFNIPSFQRGYRWRSEQVEDMLKDLCDFVNDDESSIYYLQPLVVRGAGHSWEVLDGQQRLTTIRLILHELEKHARVSNREKAVYRIHYLNRPELDMNRVSPTDNLDSYYVDNALRTIRQWKATKTDDDLSEIVDMLYGSNKRKKAKFIWYEVDGAESTDSEAIAIFNRLNRGKIRLTPSELIKALLIISDDGDDRGRDARTVLSMEWDEIERRFMDDEFFAFINAGNRSYDTRMDLLFNYVARSHGVAEKDSDFAYRWFQGEFDRDKASVLRIWEDEVKSTYDMLTQWYADAQTYNYIGFLSQCGVSIADITGRLTAERAACRRENGRWHKSDTASVLRKLISEQFKPLKLKDAEIRYPAAIDELDYHDTPTAIRRVLLLFNVVFYSNRQERFPFHRYVDEKWDIEHVDSQTLNPLTQNDDQRQWLQYAREVVGELPAGDPATEALLRDMDVALAEGVESPQWIGRYRSLYDRVTEMMTPSRPVVDKDAPGNLTLLDAATNRGYGNALFPYKSKSVVNRDKTGAFVPRCTLNLFMKYYTSAGSDTGGLNRMKWSEDDAQAHLAAIHHHLDPFFT